MQSSKRNLLFGAASVAAIAMIWRRFGIQKVNFAFEPIPGLTGWQRGQAGELTAPRGSASEAVFLGIDGETVEVLPADVLCDTLYRSVGPGLQVAVFTDAFCPNCQLMDPMLASRADLSITWHELPILGPASEQAARAMLAAGLQGKHDAFKNAFLKSARTQRPTALINAAAEVGLDIERLSADMEGGAVNEALRSSRAAAETLGIWGTPAIAIGRSVLIGRLTSDELDHVLEFPLGNCP